MNINTFVAEFSACLAAAVVVSGRGRTAVQVTRRRVVVRLTIHPPAEVQAETDPSLTLASPSSF